MEIEKVTEIKNDLEICMNSLTCENCSYHSHRSGECCRNLTSDILTYINELESENERLKECYKVKAYDKLREENKTLKDRIVKLEKDNEMLRNAKVVYETVDYCAEDLRKAQDRIAELEKENKSLYDSYHKGYKAGYEYGKQDAFSSERAESDNQTSETTQSDYRLKQFAERLKNKLEEYRLDNEYFTEHEPNGNLWQMNSSMFCIEVTQDGGLIDETLKEFIDKV